MCPKQNNLRAELAATRSAAGAPGVAAIVLSAETILAHEWVGVRRLGRSDNLRAEDKFHIGSNAKAMTATLCAALVNENRLEWATQPAELFPDLAATIHPDYAHVTLEQILRHRAGLPPFTEMAHLEAAPEFAGTPTEQRQAFAAWLLAQPPHLPPDSSMSYSNAGYGLAAALLEAKTGQSWESLLNHYLFAPLALDAGIGWPGRDGSEQPWGHMAASESDPLTPVDPINTDYQLPPILAPAGDIHLSMTDYGKFLQLNLRALQGRDTNLPASALRYLHQDVDGVGLGWGIQQFAGQTVSVHAGGGGTFIIVGLVHHHQDLAAAVVANAGTDQAEAAVVAQLKALFAAYS